MLIARHHRLVATVLGAALLSACQGADPALPEPKVSAREDIVEVAGLAKRTIDAWRATDPSAWSAALQVRLIDPELPKQPRPLAGSYSVHADQIQFRPRFPLAPGENYLVRLDRSALDPSTQRPTLEEVVTVPAAATEPPRIVQVFPTGPVVPENLLKFHLHFSAPIPEGEVLKRVYLADGEGKRIEKALLPPILELWDRDRRSLTVLLDPSRVKTGLIANEQQGRALKAGGKVQLVVEPGWKDMTGAVASERIVRTFTVTPEDRAAKPVSEWSLDAPKVGTTAAVALRLPEPMDQACLASFVRVVDSDGKVVAGDIKLSEGDTKWTFTPQATWSAQHYEVVVDPQLEDLAGNNLIESFDHPIGSHDQALDAPALRIPFTPLA